MFKCIRTFLNCIMHSTNAVLLLLLLLLSGQALLQFMANPCIITGLVVVICHYVQDDS